MSPKEYSRLDAREDGTRRTYYYTEESCGIAAGLFIAAVHPKLFKPEGRDLVALQVEVTGQKQGKPDRVTFRLIDPEKRKPIKRFSARVEGNTMRGCAQLLGPDSSHLPFGGVRI